MSRWFYQRPTYQDARQGRKLDKTSKKLSPNNKVAVDKLHPTIIEWPLVWHVCILDTTCTIGPIPRLVWLLPHQLSWCCVNNKEGMEVPSYCLLWGGPLQHCDQNNNSHNQFLSRALQHTYIYRSNSEGPSQQLATRTWLPGQSITLQFLNLGCSYHWLLD